jgi:hypothetical protein
MLVAIHFGRTESAEPFYFAHFDKLGARRTGKPCYSVAGFEGFILVAFGKV